MEYSSNISSTGSLVTSSDDDRAQTTDTLKRNASKTPQARNEKENKTIYIMNNLSVKLQNLVKKWEKPSKEAKSMSI